MTCLKNVVNLEAFRGIIFSLKVNNQKMVLTVSFQHRIKAKKLF